MWTLRVLVFRVKSLEKYLHVDKRECEHMNTRMKWTTVNFCAYTVIEAQPVWMRVANTHHVYLRNMFSLCFMWHFSYFFFLSSFFHSVHPLFHLGVDLCYHLCSITVLWATDEELNADERACTGTCSARWSQYNNLKVHLSPRKI